MQQRRQLAAKHCLDRSDTCSRVDNGVPPEKELTEAALHRACDVLDQNIL